MSLARKKATTSPAKWQLVVVVLMLGVMYSSDSFATKILVFSKVAEGGERHGSIPKGISAIHEIGAEEGWEVDETIDSHAFNRQNLERYDLVVWNNTSGEVLD